MAHVIALQGAYQEQATELRSAKRELEDADEIQIKACQKLDMLENQLAYVQKELQTVRGMKEVEEQEPSMGANEIQSEVRKVADSMGEDIRKQMQWQ